MKEKTPPILCIDFDGVLHSYTSGWQGARVIPDPPVTCLETGITAIEWLSALVPDGEAVCAMAPRYLEFDVRIFSSRSRYWGGRAAMKQWLVKWGFPKDKLENLGFPLLKPPAHLLIDDRAWTFMGRFPQVAEIQAFKPWNKKVPGRLQ